MPASETQNDQKSAQRKSTVREPVQAVACDILRVGGRRPRSHDFLIYIGLRDSFGRVARARAPPGATPRDREGGGLVACIWKTGRLLHEIERDDAGCHPRPRHFLSAHQRQRFFRAMKSPVLLLNPSTAYATPRHWQALALGPGEATSVPCASRYHEVHCVGGGSLLLFLLLRAGLAPRASRVVMHGELVLPTPESCNRWVARVDPSFPTIDGYTWRREATLLGAGGGLRKSAPWLESLMRCVASGQHDKLAAEALSLAERWDLSGRLRHMPPLEVSGGGAGEGSAEDRVEAEREAIEEMVLRIDAEAQGKLRPADGAAAWSADGPVLEMVR